MTTAEHNSLQPGRQTGGDTDVAGRTFHVIGAAMATAMLGAPGLAYAGYTPPAGVTAYRLVFMTDDTTDASSSSIVTYNNFVTEEADQNSALAALNISWTAIASTADTSALSNTGSGTSLANLPIYLVDGTSLVALNLAGLFGGDPGVIDEDQFGNSDSGYVWTGSNSDGTASTDAMGTATPELGVSNTYFGGPDLIDSGALGGADEGYSLYAISGEIDVVATPEPASGAALLAGGLVVTGVFRRKRQR